MSNLSETLRPLIRELEAARKAANALEAKEEAAHAKVSETYAQKRKDAQARVDAAQETLEIAVRGAKTSAPNVEADETYDEAEAV